MTDQPCCLFFDVDGVLINGFHADPRYRIRWDRDMERDLGIRPADLDQALFREAFAEIVLGRRDLREALSEILPQIGYHGMPDAVMAYWFEKDSDRNADLFTAIGTLRQFSPHRLFVATGQEHHRARYLWDVLGFRQTFERMFYSADMGIHKSDPRFFQEILRELRVDPGDCLHVDDSPSVLAAADAVGFRTLHYVSEGDFDDTLTALLQRS